MLHAFGCALEENHSLIEISKKCSLPLENALCVWVNETLLSLYSLII